MRGAFIVLEGTDGSGKGTQYALLVERLAREGVPFAQADFPQYGRPSAYFVEQYLTGRYGAAASDVSPRVASLFFALDRYDKAPEIKAWLAEGKLVVSNRYTTSNLGHQAGKAHDAAERERIVAYIESLEYGELEIPRPDKVILVAMHPFVAQQLIASKGARAYLDGKKQDIHENDLEHLRRAAESYLWVARRDPTWTIVDCMRSGLSEERLLDATVSPLEKVKTVEEIHALVWEEIRKTMS